MSEIKTILNKYPIILSKESFDKLEQELESEITEKNGKVDKQKLLEMLKGMSKAELLELWVDKSEFYNLLK